MTLNQSTVRVRVLGAFLVMLVATLGLSVDVARAALAGGQLSAGWYTESEDVFIGAGAHFGLGTITLIPNVEWLFVDGGSAYTLNVDATMSLVPLGVASIYAGAGAGLFTVDPEVGDGDSEFVVNLIGGAGFNALPLKPFAQLKWVVVDGEDPVAFSVGTRF